MFMANEYSSSAVKSLERAIHFIRGQKVMLDSDLAKIYGVSTAHLNQQLKRNRKRFPKDFVFQLTRQEFTHLMSQIVISKAIRKLLEPASPPVQRPEIGFHVKATKEQDGRSRQSVQK
jgi:hypothetical protein